MTTMKTATRRTTSHAILWIDEAHKQRKVCPGCNLDLSLTAMVEIVYTFEVCACPAWDYEHLTEQLWHRDCYTDREGSASPSSDEGAMVDG